MSKFVIKTETEKITSINRTIRIKPETFDRITLLSEKHSISFNKLVNQCLEFALENLEEK